MIGMVTTKITKPRNCLLGIALPLTKNEFMSDLAIGANKDFAKSRQRNLDLTPSALWEIDYEPLVNLLMQLKTEMEQLGVTVITGFGRQHFSLIDNYDIFTIVAHWVEEKEQVELHDGLIPAFDFDRLIPENFPGIIDLTVCTSYLLQQAIKKRRKNVVLANSCTTSVQYRMIQYKYCMRLLDYKNYNYVDAVAEVRKNV